ncbi:MAG TPA: hypothetical protein VNV60_05330 [Holophagaceae bacterium]|jgi:hypothetical protein|nr:hypothetical protein [Holophagaceae bacterium]
MPMRASDVSGALLKKGFKEAKSKDRRFVYWHADGTKSIISTMISHGESELTDSLIGRMACQMKIRKAEFNKFVECTMDQATYEATVFPKPESERTELAEKTKSEGSDKPKKKYRN